MPGFSPKQQAALNKAAPAARSAMRKLFQEQAAPVRAKAQNPRTKPTANAPRARPLQRQTVQTVPNYLDPMCKAPMPASLSDGRALAHTSLISKDFKVPKYESTGDPATFPGPTILLVTNTGSTATVGLLVKTRIVEGGTMKLREDGIKQEIFNIPTLSGSDVGGHPTAGRSMKVGVSVINNSNALKRGGRVTYLNTFQRLPDIGVGGTSTDPTYYWDHVVDAIKAAPDRRRINGDNLVTPKQSVGAIVDTIKYHEFNRWKPTESKLEFINHVLDRLPTGVSWVDATMNADSSRPMSTIAYVFDPTDDAQDYSVTVRAAFYTRWPLTSVPGQSMSPIPTATTTVINGVAEHAANKAGELTAVVAGGVAGAKLATVAPRAADAVRRWNVARAREGPGFGALQAEIAEAEAAVAAEMVPVLGAIA